MADAASLLRRSVAADNAAMENEPTKVDVPKRGRHRFQFRLRTLLIGVTVVALACWGVVLYRRAGELICFYFRLGANCRTI
jgi:hypothetical protein